MKALGGSRPTWYTQGMRTPSFISNVAREPQVSKLMGASFIASFVQYMQYLVFGTSLSGSLREY